MSLTESVDVLFTPSLGRGRRPCRGLEHELLFFGVQCKITTKQINEDVFGRKKIKKRINKLKFMHLMNVMQIFLLAGVCVCA